VNIRDRFNIPADLREREQWVVWRRESRGGTQTKVPYRAGKTNVRASTAEARTWAAFEHAVRVLERGDADGVGFVFADTDSFCGVDLDNCRNPETGELDAKAAAIVDALDSYTEVSPSGTGIHVIVRARLDGGRRRRSPVEIYDRGRYFAMTGDRLPGVSHTPVPRQRELDELRVRLFPPRRTRMHDFRPRDVSDEELLELALRARNASDFRALWEGRWDSRFASHSEADLALCGHLAFWTGGDSGRIDRLFCSSGLYRDKWERPDYREKTIAVATRRAGS